MTARTRARLKTISRWTLGLALVIAGFNHFRNPDFYVRLIPAYLPLPYALNAISGILEVVLGGGLLIRRTRRAAALGIVLLLLAFLPVHVQPLIVGECMTPEGPCLPMWAWTVRLVLIHPLLIAWAWWHTAPDDSNGQKT
jgi:uncharacterized membrane protein